MPKPPRFFITPDQVAEPRVIISGADVRHIRAVLRMKTGDELLLCDGMGIDYTARITGMDRSAITAEIIRRSKRDIQYPRVTLGQGLPKSDKMDWIVQKATELGVADIVPIVTERTIVKVKDRERRTVRWQKICRESAMQSGRADIPQVRSIMSLEDFLRTLKPEPQTLLLLPWEEAVEPIKGVMRQTPGVKNIIVLIGPEGGFSKDEAEQAKNNGFHLVGLGRNILRTETAALAVLSMIGYEYR